MAEEGPRWNAAMEQGMRTLLAGLDPALELPERLAPESARALLLTRPELLEATRRELANTATDFWRLASCAAQWQREAAATALLAEQMASRQTRPV